MRSKDKMSCKLNSFQRRSWVRAVRRIRNLDHLTLVRFLSLILAKIHLKNRAGLEAKTLTVQTHIAELRKLKNKTLGIHMSKIFRSSIPSPRPR